MTELYSIRRPYDMLGPAGADAFRGIRYTRAALIEEYSICSTSSVPTTSTG
jgi:hypothetical protein